MLATNYIVVALYLCDFPGCPVVKTHTSGMVPFLVGELRSHISHSAAKNSLKKITFMTIYLSFALYQK